MISALLCGSALLGSFEKDLNRTESMPHKRAELIMERGERLGAISYVGTGINLAHGAG